MKAEWIGLFLACASVGLGETPPNAGLLSLPLSFEANHGQTEPAVKFLSRGNGYVLLLTPDGAVFKLRQSHETSSPAIVSVKLADANPHANIDGAQPLPGKVNYFLGNDPHKWIRGSATFGKVNYQQVYRGIDLVYYGTQRRLEYDFIVEAGADPNQIALEFSGARPKIGQDGDLQLILDGGPLTFRKPVVYQTIAGKKEIVEGNYRLSGRRIQFALGKYDHNRALVIDPVVDYLTYLGGSNNENAGNVTYGSNPTQGVAADTTGNVYVTGYTQSADFPVQNAIQSTSSTLAATGFVTKLNPAGSQLIYSTYIGGSVINDGSTTRPYAIAVDSSGDAYITGLTSSQNFPATSGAYQTVCGVLGSNGKSNCPAAQSAFLTKLNPSGSVLYSTFIGPSSEIGVAVAVDSQGKAYVAGTTIDGCASNDPINCFPTTANAVLPGSTFNNTLNPGNTQQGSAFICVFDAAGANLLYSSLFGGTGNQSTGNGHSTYANGVAVDPSGNFYLAGTTGSNQLPVTPGAFQTTYYGNPTPGFSTATRGFVAKFNPVTSGAALAYTTYLGGTDPTQLAYQDFVAGIAVDAAGNAYVSGSASYNFPVTAGANNTIPCAYTLCENRGFLAKLNPAGSALVWATFVGNETNPNLSSASTITPPRLDAEGNVYVGGIAGSGMQYPQVSPLQPPNNNGGAYVTMFDPSGSTIYFSTVFYDPAANGGIFTSGVDVDPQGNIYVAGYTSRSGLPITAGAFQTAVSGSNDVFIAKISAPVIPTIAAVANAEGGSAAIAPNTWVEIAGSNLSPAGDSRQWQSGDFVNSQLPTHLDGVSVTVNGNPAYVAYISPTQVNILTPPNAISGQVPVQVTNNGTPSTAFMAQAQAVAPSFFVFNGGPYVVATHADGSYVGPATLYPGLSTPAQPSETIVVYANGFGPTSTPVANGSLTQSGTLSPPPVITIGSTPATVAFAGLIGPGEFQFNVMMPSSIAGGDQRISATYNGLTTQPGTLITVEQ